MHRPTGDGKGETGQASRRSPAVALLAVGLALVVGVAAVAFYREQVAPLRAHVLIVDGHPLDMEYFVKRVRLAGQRPLAMLPQLAIEEMIRLVAPQPPYGIAVADADIDAALMQMAAGDRASPTESEFDEWYRQQLNETGFTDAEFRGLVRVRLLSSALADYLAARVPTVAEQVRLQLIVRPSLGDASAAKARLDAGEDFADLAVALNDDDELRASAGELGWRPAAALAPVLARTAFELLDVGDVGGPVPIGGNRFAVVRVAERSEAMAIDAEVLQSIRARALDAWAAEELKRHRVEYSGFNGGYDSETDAWVMRQLGDARPGSDRRP